MAKKKVLTQEGVQRLWAAIEAKFIDNNEIAALLAEVEPGTLMEALTNAEIDAITGYVEPQSEPDPDDDQNQDPETPSEEQNP